LDAYGETIKGLKEKHTVDRVIFGYVNTFKFNADESFDLNKYFKILFGTAVESAKSGISHLGINFRFNHGDVEVMVDLNVMQTDSSQIMVVTKVEGQKAITEDITFEEKENILQNVYKIKEAAKTVFFDLTTDETKELLGAK
jgi:uncharacterized protein (TIGR04255 family)